jgi:hypothetical protein
MPLIKDFLRDLREARKRDRIRAEFNRASQMLERNDPKQMVQLAQSSVGDAWDALARWHHAHNDEIEATNAWEQATQSRVWLASGRWSVCQDAYDRRRFLGLGAVPDYRALAREWERHHFPGMSREGELAWIYSQGLAEGRDARTAWSWLSIGRARWGDRVDATELPDMTVADLRKRLVQQVPAKVRAQLDEVANRQAYAEFVSQR